jgi:hypothetical protein
MTDRPALFILAAVALVLIVAALVAGTRTPPPDLPKGTIYYTGPMKGKGQAGHFTGVPGAPAGKSGGPSRPEAGTTAE